MNDCVQCMYLVSSQRCNETEYSHVNRGRQLRAFAIRTEIQHMVAMHSVVWLARTYVILRFFSNHDMIVARKPRAGTDRWNPDPRRNLTGMI